MGRTSVIQREDILTYYIYIYKVKYKYFNLTVKCILTGVTKAVVCVCGMVHIKQPLLLIGKSSLCVGSGFPLPLSEWFFTICLTPYNRK